MKKILMLLIVASSLLFAEDKTITINDEATFYNLIGQELDKAKTKYKMTTEAKIRIDENGIFSYKIISESDVTKFNEDLKIFLDEKTKIKFPNLKNKPMEINALFEAKSIEKQIRAEKLEKIIEDNKRKKIIEENKPKEKSEEEELKDIKEILKNKNQ